MLKKTEKYAREDYLQVTLADDILIKILKQQKKSQGKSYAKLIAIAVKKVWSIER